MSAETQSVRYRPLSPFNIGLLVIAGLCSLVFFVGFAVPYLAFETDVLARFDGRTFWIVSHVLTGSIALFVGGPQLWMGLTGKTGTAHHKLGWIYLATIALSSITSFYLAVTTNVSWVFGLGLGGLGLAWVIAGTLALVAILKRNYFQHMEWMIRSYVVTLGFVFFRLFVGVAEGLEVGTLIERLSAASWICWALPLLVTEATMQGKKIFSDRKAT